MKSGYFRVRCSECGSLLSGADHVFCGTGCKWNYKPERVRPVGSMEVVLYVEKKAWPYRKSRRNALSNNFVLPKE